MFRKPTNRTKRTGKPRKQWDEGRAREVVEQWRASGEAVVQCKGAPGLDRQSSERLGSDIGGL